MHVRMPYQKGQRAVSCGGREERGLLATAVDEHEPIVQPSFLASRLVGHTQALLVDGGQIHGD